MRVLVVDDHAVVRRGVRKILEEEEGPLLLDEAEDAAEALRVLRRDEWNVVVLDIDLPDIGGLELLGLIRKERPRTGVLAFSRFPVEQYAVRTIRAGASGYLNKRCAAGELAVAVRKVAAGGRYITHEVGALLAQQMAVSVAEQGGGGQQPHQGLSDREYEIFLGLAAGYTMTDIAKRVGLSVKTVSSYRARVLAKLGLKGNAELTGYAVHHRLLEP